MTDIMDRLKRADGEYGKQLKRLTRGQAIREFCYQCVGKERGTREGIIAAANEVFRCSDTGCPLYRYRLGKEQ